MPENAFRNIASFIKKSNIQFILLIGFFIFQPQFARAQEYKTIVAKKGDGIYKVLRDNNIPASYVDEFLELNKSTLKGSKELKSGFKYKLPVVENKSTEPAQISENTVNISGKTIKRFEIFGNKYHDVVIESNELSGAVYYLVSGHGGPDPGAVAKYNGKTLCEDEYAYDITLRLARNLLAKGATVYMITRDKNDGIRDGWHLPADKDEVCYPNLSIPINQNARLKQRTQAVNTLYKQHKGKYQRLIVVHVDSRSKGENIDVFFYYDKRSDNGKKLAINLRNTFDRKYRQHQPGRGYHGTVSARNLYLLKYSWPVATFIELGNINHERDLRRLIIDDNRQALANWLSEGLENDFSNNK
ncbi:MAG: N-acetylmuramoyl-L-alanine amidase [Prolixibacteraceae bacterium]|nr:N-acetylmuramoyl-L-alanine amidase [Prolixibacteraceae bacterium]